MSFFDIMKNEKKNSTRQYIGIKSIQPYGIETYRGGVLLYFIVKPVNLAVLSDQSIKRTACRRKE